MWSEGTVATVAALMAKLAGLKVVLEGLLNDEFKRRGQLPIQQYESRDVEAYFKGVSNAIEALRAELPHLYDDFPTVDDFPEVEMASASDGSKRPNRYARRQVERLLRNVEHALEIRTNSELAPPAAPTPRRVFISHGRAKDWYAVQAFIEKDLGIPTLELAQQSNAGLTVLGKLEAAAGECDSAVIVMTGDDRDESGQVRARENVLHEIGYFQGKYGLARVVLLHEDGVNIPSNIQGLVYLPFPPGSVETAHGALLRELNNIYKGERA